MMSPRLLKEGDDAIVVKDRISDLHDAQLGLILGYLPTTDAVATCLLSTRWRRVFTRLKRLDFDDSPIAHCSKHPKMVDSFPVFRMFVDWVLRTCHKSVDLTTFRLNFGHSSTNCDEFCNKFVNLEMIPLHTINDWISFPLTRGVRELDVCMRLQNPDKLLVDFLDCGSQTLKVLKLDMNLGLQVPLSLDLPNLKEFYLKLHNLPDYNFVSRIVSSCRRLEHLALKGFMKAENPIEISSPSLRSLAILLPFKEDIPRSKFVLNAPNLEYLEYEDNLALHYSIGDLNAVVEARVATVNFTSEECELENVQTIFSSLANVQSLYLREWCVMGMKQGELKPKLPVFRKLKHLELDCNFPHEWNTILMQLLNRAPILETLAFPTGIILCTRRVAQEEAEEAEETADADCKLWNESRTIPHCLVFHLKKITVKKYLQTEWELDIVKYFLKSSSVLEELIIFCSRSMTMADRISLDSALKMLPRVSMACSIEVE